MFGKTVGHPSGIEKTLLGLAASVPFGSLRFLPLKADRDQWTTKEMLLEDTFLTEMTCVLAKLGKMVF